MKIMLVESLYNACSIISSTGKFFNWYQQSFCLKFTQLYIKFYTSIDFEVFIIIFFASILRLRGLTVIVTVKKNS